MKLDGSASTPATSVTDGSTRDILGTAASSTRATTLRVDDRNDGRTNASAVRHGAATTVTEADFQAAVIEVAHAFNWTCAHFRAARTVHGWRTPVAADGAGFPDLILTRADCGVLFRELKSDKGRLSDAQEQWGRVLTEAGADWAVWRPADMPDIINRLSFGRARSNL